MTSSNVLVGQCDLPFRMQCRANGSQLVYTPMFFADRFASDARYRERAFQTVAEDRPLAVQFGANDPDILLQAAKYVENHCDAVDLNLGCPQQRYL
jgi:tRNA-dihydrouridine synthase 1